MRNLLVVAAVIAAAPMAMASKARVSALGTSHQLMDVQYTFDRPSMINSMGDLVTIEWGNNAATANGTTIPKAEGGFIKKHNEMTYGLYLGKQGLLSSQAGVFMEEQNPLNLLFGMKSGEMAWGLNLGYSNGKNDTGSLKASSMQLNAGVEFGQFEVAVGSTLGAKAENATTKQELTAMSADLSYNINADMHSYLEYNTSKFENGATKTEQTIMELGFVNTFAKSEEASFFYGIAYNSNKIKDGVEKQALPIWLGVEASATSWMTMRASVKQNVLINEEKAANGNKTDADSIAFAAGAGFKLGKGMLDATFGTANSGHMSFSDGTTDKFLSNVSYTYNF